MEHPWKTSSHQNIFKLINLGFMQENSLKQWKLEQGKITVNNIKFSQLNCSKIKICKIAAIFTSALIALQYLPANLKKYVRLTMCAKKHLSDFHFCHQKNVHHVCINQRSNVVKEEQKNAVVTWTLPFDLFD